MSYIVNAPKGGQIHLSLPFGTVTLSHGDIVNNEQLIKTYPSYFIKIPDAIKVKEEKAETVKAETVKVKAPKEPKPKRIPNTFKTKKAPFTKG